MIAYVRTVLFRHSPDGGTTWDPPLDQSALNLSLNLAPVLQPQIAVAGANTYVIWTDESPGTPSIFFRRAVGVQPTHSFNDVIDNSVTVEILPGPSIKATFTPKFGLTLKQAAQLGEYDHFNWSGVIIADTLVTLFPCLQPGLIDVLGNCPTVPYIDPPHGGYLYQVVDCSQINHTICVPPVADNLDWYLDEEFTESYTKGHPRQLERNSAPLNGTRTSLDFLDSPSTFLGGNLRYRTSLVGVKSDGQGELLSFNNTKFEWSVVGTLLGPNVIERRSNFDPSLGSGTITFNGFIAAGSFTPDELRLLAQYNIAFRDISGTVKPVIIDIKPGEFPNSINPKSQGKIPVAILTTGTFDATTVNVATVRFGKAGTEATVIQSALEDVNKDGKLDLILQFNTQATGITCGQTSASLTGKNIAGQEIDGADSISTMGCN